MKAVIPAAGLGTRMLPLTKGAPKELLPVGGKPMIQHIIEEAAASGITRICIVIRKGKESIRNCFEELTASCELSFVYQHQPLGLGDAILQTKDFVGSDHFVMLVPDQLMISVVPATQQLVTIAKHDTRAIWTSLVRLPKPDVRFFPGARGFEIEAPGPGDCGLRLGRILTEEEVRQTYAEAPYEIRGFGRTVYPPEIFKYLGQDYLNPKTGEVDLLKTFEAATQRLEHRGILLAGEPLDLGTCEGYNHFLPQVWKSVR